MRSVRTHGVPHIVLSWLFGFGAAAGFDVLPMVYLYRVVYLPIDCHAMYLVQLIYKIIQTGFQPHAHVYNCWKLEEFHDCKDYLSNPF